MKTRKIFGYGIAVMLALVFGMMVTACDDGSGNNNNGGIPTATAPAIITTSLPNGVVGTAYSHTLAATGDAPITWGLESGALPAGLNLSGNTIAGTPTTANTFNFIVRAANAAGSVTKALSITIAPGGDDPILDRITVTGPAETLYLPGGAFSTAGLAVTAHYVGGSETPIDTGYTLSWNGQEISDGDTAITAGYGEQTVTVTYEGKTAVFTITVIDPNAPTPGLAYDLITSGNHAYTYRVRKGTVTGGLVVIPATHEGMPVSEISSQGFGGLIGLTAVYIPNSVTVIGDYAFASTGLTGITIPEDVTSIGSYAFQNCAGLTSVNIPPAVTTIGSNAFTGCAVLTDITIDNTVFAVSQNSNWLDIFPATGLSVTFKKYVRDYSFYVQPSYQSNRRLASVTIADSVTFIGQYAFQRSAGLTSVTIGAGVNTIYQYAFSGCTDLASVTIAEGSQLTIQIYAFSGCTSLTSVTIPNSVTSIGREAFSSCSSLASVTIGAGVIEQSAFQSCTSLASITIESGVTTIGQNAFSGCTNLASITAAANNQQFVSQDGILYNKAKTAIVHVPQAISGTRTIPASVESIESNAFSNRTGLTSVTIEGGSIDINAFRSCTSLASVTFGANVTDIASNAFSNCTGLTSVTIGANVTSIASNAFGSVETSGARPINLTSVTFAEGFSITIGDWFTQLPNLTTVNIPASVPAIGDYAFSNCTSLASITIPANATRIGPQAFYRTSLTSITIPASVTSIGRSAFYGCTSLTSVTFAAGASFPYGYPSSDDGARVFEDSPNLTSVTFQGTIQSNSFSHSAFSLGDLRTKFYATDSTNGTPGTYTTAAPVSSSSVWEKI